jgi:pimeloyl-ACP methyl ester carboxylesterase
MAKKDKGFLLIRGLTRGQGHWGDFPQLLEQKGEAPIFYVDLPGNGERFREKSPWKIDTYTDQTRPLVKAWLEKYDLQVVAVSMGAMVMSHWISHFQQDFSKAFFINTSSRKHSKPLERFNAKGLFHSPHILDPSQRESEILQLTSNNIQRRNKFSQIFQDYNKSHPVSLENTAAQITASAMYSFPESKPATEITFANSKADRLVNCSCSEKLAAAWQAPLVQHPSAGHDLPLDEPEWLVQQILDRTL